MSFDSSDLETLLATAVKAARAGAEVAQTERASLRDSDVSNKDSAWNLVTRADRAAEMAIVRAIKDAFPNHAVLGEEGTEGDQAANEHVWVIDPIDGTTNYVHGNPHYAVSVAYSFRGVVQVGACLDPNANELFTAMRGRGAWLNGAPIRTSTTTDLNQAVVATGFYYDRGEIMERTLSSIRNLFRHGMHGIRIGASAVLDLCYVACGRFDAYFEYQLSAWDFAAAALIAEEAGVRCAAADGTPLTLESNHVAVATPAVMDTFLSIVGAGAA